MHDIVLKLISPHFSIFYQYLWSEFNKNTITIGSTAFFTHTTPSDPYVECELLSPQDPHSFDGYVAVHP